MTPTDTTRTNFDETTTVDVVAKQTFTQKPAGTSYSHYGYIFATIYWDDGTSEEVLYTDMGYSKTTPVVIFASTMMLPAVALS